MWLVAFLAAAVADNDMCTVMLVVLWTNIFDVALNIINALRHA